MGEGLPVYAATTTIAAGPPHSMDEFSLKSVSRRLRLTHQQMLVLCVLAASLGSFCSGMFVGWSSHANELLADKYSSENVARITSYLALGAATSPLFAHRLWTRTGTKVAVIVSCLVMCTSIIGLFVDYGLACRLVARYASGLAIGVIQLLMPAYVQDIVKCAAAVQPGHDDCDKTTTTTTTTTTAAAAATTTTAASMMAFANDVFHLQFVLGVLTMFVTGLFDHHLPHLGCIVMVAATVAFTIAACLLPESPRFLCQRRRVGDMTTAATTTTDSDDDEARVQAARQILRQFVPDGMAADICGGQHVATERLLLQWSADADDATTTDASWVALLRGGPDGVRAGALLGGAAAVAMSQLVGVTSVLFYMEKLMSLTYDASYTPATNAALCVLCLVGAAVLPLLVHQPLPGRLSEPRRRLVPVTMMCSVTLGLFGLHCHYHGTFGQYTVTTVTPPPSSIDDDGNLLPVLLFGASFALYALGPMRLLDAVRDDDDGDESGHVWSHVRVPRGQSLRVRSVLLTVGWLCVFGVVRVLPGLVNAIGLGWLLWYMAGNAAIAAVFLRWWLRGGGARAGDLERQLGVALVNPKADIVC